ncbi:MAG: GNAT family N-acetyltransferase [Crocinitomicaceae bacterium]|nr:GNAT family N-acetyltransferase [Crocinitomicaceae bacterium]MDG1777655.1 GNAT family N-acetyltransferase [Crocinitomicaceae bacterium]
MKIDIRKPITPKEWEKYYDLRYKLLRKPLDQPLGSERNDGDLAGQHFALYENDILRAIARLDQSEAGISQVRFVAVHTDSQGKGFGKLIMNAVEAKSLKRGNHKMILHARDYAVDFYLNLGYSKIKKSYKLFGTLQHYLMEKVY